MAGAACGAQAWRPRCRCELRHAAHEKLSRFERGQSLACGARRMSQGHHAKASGAPGNVLAAAREEMNLSVTDVARHLKLSPAQVEALEDGAYERLPGRVFVRGFLRNYAKLLGIDPQPLLRSIESQMPQPAMAEERPALPQMVMPRERPARWPLYTVLVAALIVAALAVYEFGF